MKIRLSELRHLIRNIILEKSGGDPTPGDHREEVMTVGELLDKYWFAYREDVENIDSGKDTEGESWEVYETVKGYQKKMGNDPDPMSLPPIQVSEGEFVDGKPKVTDGAHRLNALNLIAKESPGVRTKKIRVQFIDKAR